MSAQTSRMLEAPLVLCGLCDLPDDLFALIMSFSSARDIVGVMRTAKHAHVLVTSLLDNILSETAGGRAHVLVSITLETPLMLLSFMQSRLQLARRPSPKTYRWLPQLSRTFTRKVVQVASSTSEAPAGESEMHAVFLCARGDVWTMGSGRWGKLGHGNEIDCHVPTRVDALAHMTDITSVEAGCTSSAAVDASGQLWVWGDNRHGKLGLNAPPERTIIIAVPTRVAVPGDDRVATVAMGTNHILIVTMDGTRVYAAGNNAWNQLGLDANTIEERGDVRALRAVVFASAPGRIVRAAAGGRHSLLLSHTMGLFGCGIPFSGELGSSQLDLPSFLGSPQPDLPSFQPVFDPELSLNCARVRAYKLTTAIITRAGLLYLCGYSAGGRAMCGVATGHVWAPMLVPLDLPVADCHCGILSSVVVHTNGLSKVYGIHGMREHAYIK